MRPARRRQLARVITVGLCAAAFATLPVACSRPGSTQTAADRAPAAPSPPATAQQRGEAAEDPVLAVVDGHDIRRSDAVLRGADPAAAGKRNVRALTLAIRDHLVLRELAVLGIKPRPDESEPAAAARLMKGVWPGRGCGPLDERTLERLFRQNRPRFRFPASALVWEARWPCCSLAADAADRCTPAERARCEAQATAAADALVATLASTLPPPAATLPVFEASFEVGGGDAGFADNPVAAQHVPAFEAAVAAVPAASAAVPAGGAADAAAPKLLRYRAFDRDDPVYFSLGHPVAPQAVSARLSSADAGAPLGPIVHEEGVSVVMLVARLTRSEPKPTDPPVRAALEAEACAAAAADQRDRQIVALLDQAHIRWQRDAIVAAFGEATAKALPEGTDERARPVLPPELTGSP